MATALAPSAGLSTPASERSIYYDVEPEDAPNQKASKESADVARKPSVAAGALEPREPASGGMLANKHESNVGAKPDSDIKATPKAGAATGGGPTADTKKHKDVGFVAVGSPSSKSDAKGPAQTHDPSPAYTEHGNAAGTGDSKATPPSNEKHPAGASGRKISKKKKKKSAPSDSTQTKAEPTPVVAARSPDQGEVSSITSHDERRHLSGAFANGAAVTRPDVAPEEDASLHQRTATAEGQIPEGAKKKITKDEVKDAKRLKKVIKAEGKAQKDNLSAFLKELARLQTIQKRVAKDESKALNASNKATAHAAEVHTKFLAAKAAYEQAEADAKVRKGALDAAKARAQETTAELAEKTREAEELRRAKAVDDRERAAKLEQLSQIGKQK